METALSISDFRREYTRGAVRVSQKKDCIVDAVESEPAKLFLMIP